MTKEEAIEILKGAIKKPNTKDGYLGQALTMGIEALENQKTGHWRHYEGMLICSECGTKFYDDIMEYCGDDVPKCCLNCGAKMEGEKLEGSE